MALGPGQTLQSAYGYQGTYNPQFQWQGNPYPPQQGSQGTVIRTSPRNTKGQGSQMYTGSMWGKGRKNTRKGRKNTRKGRKNRRSNTMRKGRRNTRK